MKVDCQAALQLVAKYPSLKPLIMRWVRAAEKGKRLPESFTAPAIDFAAQRGLEELMMTQTGRTSDGKVYGSILPMLREPSAWLEVAAKLKAGGATAPKAEPIETFFVRLNWLHPEFAYVIETLSASSEVTHYLSDVSHRADWKKLLESTLQIAQERPDALLTLSQLGSDWFNDSKILRSGPLRRQLVLMAAALARIEPDNEKEVLGGLGIEANPYTTTATIFAPITLEMFGGAKFDFPLQLYRRGLACQLPMETVGLIERIIWHDEAKEIVTSENAAPLLRFVAAGRPVLYTEGYPNYAVIMMMALLTDEGIVAEHWGDADLDGLRIGEEVCTYMPGSRIVAERILASPNGLKGIPLTEGQLQRLERHIERNPDSPYLDSLKRLLKGWWYEQESFPCA